MVFLLGISKPEVKRMNQIKSIRREQKRNFDRVQQKKTSWNGIGVDGRTTNRKRENEQKMKFLRIVKMKSQNTETEIETQSGKKDPMFVYTHVVVWTELEMDGTERKNEQTNDRMRGLRRWKESKQLNGCQNFSWKWWQMSIHILMVANELSIRIVYVSVHLDNVMHYRL